MREVQTIGIDLAKHSFYVYGVDANGKKILGKTLLRGSVGLFFSNLPLCLVGMEACAGSSYWQRIIQSYGHTVKRMHPKYVKPYLVGDKNDANDARAICEAVQRPNMRFVPDRTQQQADIQAIHRVRAGLVQSRTAAVNQIRGLLGENGIVIRQGISAVRSQLAAIIEDKDNELSGIMRNLLNSCREHFAFLDAQIKELDTALQQIIKESEPGRRLLKIPGIGAKGASILLVMIGVAANFANGREFAAYLGLVPREHSTGGKHTMLGISKRGDTYARTVLIHGARAVIRSVMRGGTPCDPERGQWLTELIARRGINRAVVALANKTARTAFSMVKHDTEYGKAA